MKFPYVFYKSHFENYGSSFYVLEHELPNTLNEEERELLLHGGLPDEGLPFFFFDLHLKAWRDIHIEDCLLPLGTCESPDSHHYIYLSGDHTVHYCDRHGTRKFVNSNLKALMESILEYSLWLDEIEKIVEQVGQYSVSEEDVFELFYQLRKIDPEAVCEGSLWKELVCEQAICDLKSEEDEG